MPRLQLPTVTLCAVSSVNIAATVKALRTSLDQIDFAECLFFTDAEVRPPAPIRVIPIERLHTPEDYSTFLLHKLGDRVRTAHCLVVQWDGFVIDASAWDSDYLHYDYIGAPWPQFEDGRDVGNGGFSLRSARLLQACLDSDFKSAHPEDLAICRMNRDLLESRHGIRFADRQTAERFAFERTKPRTSTFGFHGAFNLVPLFGTGGFRETYLSLDDRTTIFRDLRLLLKQLARDRVGNRLRGRLVFDWIRWLASRNRREAQAT
jgi:hypothetical protein